MQLSPLLQCNSCHCDNVALAAATMQLSPLLQCSSCCCYNAVLTAATMQLSPLLQCSSRFCYNAVLAAATMQFSLLLQCSSRRCYSAALTAAAMQFSALLQCSSRCCYNAVPAAATVQFSLLLQCSFRRCYSAVLAVATMQFLPLLQCSSHCCYNAVLAAATMQLSLLLQCSSRRCYSAVLASATMQFSPLLQCSSRRCYNAAPDVATMQFSPLLQSSSHHCYNAALAAATMQLLQLLQCSTRHCTMQHSPLHNAAFASTQCSIRRSTMQHSPLYRSSKTAPLPPVPPKSAYASADCTATLKRFAIQAGFSPAVAGQLIFSRRLSTRLNYQARWRTYRKWCKDFRHRSSSPSIAKIADFLTYMFKSKGAALSTIKGYRAMLAVVFKFPLPEISSSSILKDLIRSFEISAPRPIFPPPPWDLDKVLEFLSGPPFEPLARASFLDKTKKALFLLAMATAKRVSELQALSFSVSFQGEDLVLYYDPFFRAKTESVINPLPRSVIVPSLLDFAGDLPERLHCPVRAVKYLRKAARSASFIPPRLFVSPRNPERSMSKNAMSFYLRQLIIDSGAVSSARPPRADDIRGIATSLNYYSNLSLSSLMQVATWRSKRVFASRYLKEVSATQDNIQQFVTMSYNERGASKTC